MFGQSGLDCWLRDEPATSPCSIWPSIASSAAAMWLPSRLRTWHRTATRSTEQHTSEEDRPARQVRADRSDPRSHRRLSDGHKQEGRRISIHGSKRCLPVHDDPPARLVSGWIASIGLDPKLFGTHSLRRTKATLIYRRTGNLRAVQLLLGHTKIESTVRYLGIEVDDALSIAEQIDV